MEAVVQPAVGKLDYGMNIAAQSFLDELNKIAESKTDRALAVAPAAGAVAGGALGASNAKYFNPGGLFKKLKGKGNSSKSRAVSAVLGAGMGATTGWLPSTVRDAARAIKPRPSGSGK